MKLKHLRLVANVSAIALMSAAVSSPAQAFWFTSFLGIKKPSSKPTPAPTPAPTPTPTPTPPPPPPPPPPSGSTGGATDVPEPGMIGLFGLGVAGLAVSRGRRAKAKKQQA